MERLRQRGGDERFRALLSDQSHASARRIYGDDLGRWIAEFEADLFTGS